MTRETRMAFKELVDLGNILSTDVRDGKLYVVYIAPKSRCSRCEVFEGEDYIEADKLLKEVGYIA